jgi:hypothetical protein
LSIHFSIQYPSNVNNAPAHSPTILSGTPKRRAISNPAPTAIVHTGHAGFAITDDGTNANNANNNLHINISPFHIITCIILNITKKVNHPYWEINTATFTSTPLENLRFYAIKLIRSK